jgi:hypothetical protein
MKQKIEIEVNIPEGYEATGEYRIPLKGEQYYSPWMDTVYVAAGHEKRVIIVRKVEPVKRMRPMTHAEVFKAIRDGAVVKHNFHENVYNYFGTDCRIEEYRICYDYAGTESDVWQKMVVEE